MTTEAVKPVPLKLFPCPFCRSRAVRLIGGSRLFRHYECDDCAEVWTATEPPKARDWPFGHVPFPPATLQ
jgi:transposase-like protein